MIKAPQFAPRAEECLAVGGVKIPFIEVGLADTNRRYQIGKMVELGKEAGGLVLYEWLFKPLGYTERDWFAGRPYQLPFWNELMGAIEGPQDLKRGRDGFFHDSNGRVVDRGEILDITVRGKHLKAYNSTKVLRVDLYRRCDIDWLFQCLQADVEAKNTARALALKPAPVCPLQFFEALEAKLYHVRLNPRIYTARWDMVGNRVRLVCYDQAENGELLKATYVNIEGYQEIVSAHLAGDPKAIASWLDVMEHLVEAADRAAKMRRGKPNARAGTVSVTLKL